LKSLFRTLELGPNAFGCTIRVKHNGGFIVSKGDDDFIATGLKTAIADGFPGSFKQSITMLIKYKLGDQNVSDHAAIPTGSHQINRAKPERLAVKFRGKVSNPI